MRDVAAELGVSVMTVSNAYRRPDQLSAALRHKVFAAAGRLGYTGPNPLGRNLRRGSSRVVGVLLSKDLAYAFTNPAATAFLAGLAGELQAAGLAMTLLPSRHQGRPPTIDQAVDGFVIYSLAQDDPLVAFARRGGHPVVVVDQPALAATPYVGIDDHAAAALAAEHVAALGHRDVTVLIFPLHEDGLHGPVTRDRLASSPLPVSRRRTEGYLTGLRAHHIQPEIIEAPHDSIAAGRATGTAVLTGPHPPTAVLAASDQLALGVLAAAAETGRSVPQHISIVGFDDIDYAAAASPALTTVRQPHQAKGAHAGRVLIDLLAGRHNPGHKQILDCELVIRGSTANPPTTR